MALKTVRFATMNAPADAAASSVGGEEQAKGRRCPTPPGIAMFSNVPKSSTTVITASSTDCVTRSAGARSAAFSRRDIKPTHAACHVFCNHVREPRLSINWLETAMVLVALVVTIVVGFGRSVPSANGDDVLVQNAWGSALAAPIACVFDLGSRLHTDVVYAVAT